MIFKSQGISVSGIPQIDARLKSLSNEMKEKIVKRAHIYAAEPLINSARTNIKFRTGNLNRSIGIETNMRNPYRGVGEIIVGPRRGKGFKGYHGHLLEFGHKTRPSTKTNIAFGLIQSRTYSSRYNGKPGFVKPYPFLKPALDINKNKILSMIKFYVADGVDKYIKKLSKIK